MGKGRKKKAQQRKAEPPVWRLVLQLLGEVLGVLLCILEIVAAILKLRGE